jgi:hypothetical protein
MLPLSKVNEAFDKLNLPRDASLQGVHDRIRKLRDRFTTSGDKERLEEAEEAFAVIEAHDAAKRAQRDMASIHNRTRSERDLDGKLITLSNQMAATSGSTKRSHPEVAIEEVKKQKTEDDIKQEDDGTSTEVYSAPSAPVPSGDEVVFEKLNALLQDESKYIRALNVLCNVLKSIIDSNRISPSIIDLIFNTLEIVMSAKACAASAEGIKVPLANANEDNRKAVSKLFTVITSSDDHHEIHLENVEEFKKWIETELKHQTSDIMTFGFKGDYIVIEFYEKDDKINESNISYRLVPT